MVLNRFQQKIQWTNDFQQKINRIMYFLIKFNIIRISILTKVEKISTTEIQ